MSIYTDQLGNTIELATPPARIISLVPSQTELLYDLGMEDEVVGITKFCIHPQQWFKAKQRVGGTKTVNIETVKELKPDLIIANREENIKEQIEALQQFAPVWVSDVNNLEDALTMITAVGEITLRPTLAAEMVNTIQNNFHRLPVVRKQPSTAYLIWKDPYMVAGGDTFISDMMHRCGLNNCFSFLNRYPEITIEDIRKSGCELLLLSSEPYPFNNKHMAELQSLLPECKIMLVDGEMFSWYGSRLKLAPAYFEKEILANISLR